MSGNKSVKASEKLQKELEAAKEENQKLTTKLKMLKKGVKI